MWPLQVLQNLLLVCVVRAGISGARAVSWGGIMALSLDSVALGADTAAGLRLSIMLAVSPVSSNLKGLCACQASLEAPLQRFSRKIFTLSWSVRGTC